MRTAIRANAFCAATALTIVLPASAYAQEAPEEGARGSSDIIVTARRSEERLQDVPISITVFSQEQLSDRNVITATDLATYTPSLSVQQRFGPEKSSFAIRGFVQEAGTQPSVGVYFAEVVAPRANGGTVSGNTAAVGSFMDLQNVQVLKGPQGTLFGRNTTGGAVLLVPNKPNGNFEGNIEASVGNFGLRRLQGVLNVPLADAFKVRLALDRQKRDGYAKNRSGIGADDYQNVDYFAARLAIVADLTPDLENYTLGTYSNSFGHGYSPRVVACDRGATETASTRGLIQTSRELLSTLACAQIDRQNARGDSLYDVESPNPDPYIKIKQWGVINTTTWAARDALTIKNVVSYQEFRERSSFTLFGDNFTVPTGGIRVRLDPRLPISALPAGQRLQFVFLQPRPYGDVAAQSTFTEELQFQGSALDGALKWQAGAYLEVSDPIGRNTGRSGNLLNCVSPQTLNCTNPIGVGLVQDSQTTFNFNTKGLYAQATYNLTELLSLTSGIRYTIDKTSATNRSVRINPVGGRMTCNDTVTFGSGAVTDPEQCFRQFNLKSEKPTWLIDVDYKPTDDLLLYAKYARGYRAGGINTTSVAAETWQPEKVDSYELGAKASFNGSAPGYLNVAAFYNNFINQQLTVSGVSSVPGFAGTAPTVNAGKSRIQGVEIDGVVTIFENFRFEAGYSYIKTKLISITVPVAPNPPYSAFVPLSTAGGPLTLTPKNRVTLTGTYTLPLDESIGDISFGATYIHTDKQFYAGNTLPQYRYLPATDLLNLNANWNNVLGQPFDISVFMTNATNVKYHSAITTSYVASGFETVIMAPPRMWGVRLKYRFGS